MKKVIIVASAVASALIIGFLLGGNVKSVDFLWTQIAHIKQSSEIPTACAFYQLRFGFPFAFLKIDGAGCGPTNYLVSILGFLLDVMVYYLILTFIFKEKMKKAIP